MARNHYENDSIAVEYRVKTNKYGWWYGELWRTEVEGEEPYCVTTTSTYNEALGAFAALHHEALRYFGTGAIQHR